MKPAAPFCMQMELICLSFHPRFCWLVMPFTGGAVKLCSCDILHIHKFSLFPFSVLEALRQLCFFTRRMVMGSQGKACS